jgi:hypothetical protein
VPITYLPEIVLTKDEGPENGDNFYAQHLVLAKKEKKRTEGGQILRVGH